MVHIVKARVDGPLGVDTGDSIVFDIAANDGIGCAMLQPHIPARAADVGEGMLNTPPLPAPVRAGARLVAAAIVFLSGAFAAPAAASTAFGLTPANQIVIFDTSTPGTTLATVAITGLEPGEAALGIDLRPATGQVYLLGSSSRVYVVNPATGAATAVGAPFTPALSGTHFGFDFNPTVDRIRVVSDTGQNLRLNPDTGAAAATDGPLNPGAPRVVGSAYLTNVAGAMTTTLFAIDATSDRLLIQNPPNNGSLVDVGPLGVDTGDEVGFDVAANDNRAFATLTVAGTTGLYRVDLSTGAATFAGTVAAGPLRGFTLLARGVAMVGLHTSGVQLVRFHSASPGTIQATIPIAGLQPGETIVGIDVRPANGQLYGVGSTSRLYAISAVTGQATAIGGVFSAPLSGTRFGVDFNPVVDRLRIVSDAEQNLRVNPDTGAVVTPVDGALAPAGLVAGAAYLNNVDGTASTTLYDIDAATDTLVIQNPPNNGTLTTVGGLGVDTTADVGFDISPLDNVGFAALTTGGTASLYTIDLLTGAATLVGAIGAPVSGLAAMPVTYQFAEGSTGSFFDTDLLLANPTASSVPVTITYVTDTARVVTESRTLMPQTRTTVSADANAQLGDTAFSATVVSHLGVPIAVERTMRWGEGGYGMHTEKAAPALSRAWFFAEGAQGFYHTYFLLTNPSPAANTATVRFLREDGVEVTRTYPLAAQSRLTIYAGEIAELVNQSFGTVVSFAFAGAAERAMYFGTPVFNGGHESAGVTRTSTDWFLAEGATGSFFTTFVLLSNPNAAPANVTLTYLREGGGTITRTRTLAPGTRATINVALEDASLAATSVATRVTSDVGIVAERAMYWPFDPAQWQEAHNAFGVTETALRWGLAEGRVGGPSAFQTFVLVANPGSTAANVTITFLRGIGSSPVTRGVTVAAGGRLTLTTGPGSMVPELADESFGIAMTSDVPVFAERALYSNTPTVFWAAGSAATASPLP